MADGHIVVIRSEPSGKRLRVLRPWLARITGAEERYGLQREFVRATEDWAHAEVGYLGVCFGVVHVWAVRVGWIVEIEDPGICDPRLPKRRFGRVCAKGVQPMTREEVLAWAQLQPA